MRRKMIPDQDDLVAADEASQFFEKGDQAFGVETVRLGPGKEARLLAVPTKTQCGRHRCFGPVVAASFQDRCFPPRRPGAADGGLLGKAGFILKVDPGALLSSFFFSSGQRTFFQ